MIKMAFQTLKYHLAMEAQVPNLNHSQNVYPQYGDGGARQLVPKAGKIIDIDAESIDILPEK